MQRDTITANQKIFHIYGSIWYFTVGGAAQGDTAEIRVGQDSEFKNWLFFNSLVGVQFKLKFNLIGDTLQKAVLEFEVEFTT